MKNRIIICFGISAVLLAAFLPAPVDAQTFTKITDPSNPIVGAPAPKGYMGASWIDYNNDGLLDLWMNPGSLFRNDDNGHFTLIDNHSIGSGQIQTAGSGNSWADYDNDGLIDVYVSGGSSRLYHNKGNGEFEPIRTGAVADSDANRGWACAWGDYNNDGYVDLVVTHPAGFVGVEGPTTNHLFLNSGPPNFTFIADTGVVVKGLAPYTVATWSDYDGDGDFDLFIGSGPASGKPAPDYLYKNMLKESGTAYFTRITTAPIGTDLVDGQVWNWIDYDNDGDLDAFLTNYNGGGGMGRPNNLYRNDNGTYVRVPSAAAGSIVSDKDFSLANVWGDFDNDGDLDLIVSNDAGSPVRYYRNEGNGSFTPMNSLFGTESPRHGVSVGDYDNDGDLDVFITGPTNGNGLFRNDLSSQNHWINIHLTGVQSNWSAIGATVKAKAMIQGKAMWQRRDVSAQNSFNGQNMLNVHFGFADAVQIDSLIIVWPLGEQQLYTNVQTNRFYKAIEGENDLLSVTEIRTSGEVLPFHLTLFQNYPNPFNPTTEIKYRIRSFSNVSLRVFDSIGRVVATLVNGVKEAGDHTATFDASTLASGIYFTQLQSGGEMRMKKMLLLK